jgi:hypothetical protein
MKSEFKLGDIFYLKYSRDTIPLKIIEVVHKIVEPEYTLRPVRYNGIDIVLGESGLKELFRKSDF